MTSPLDQALQEANEALKDVEELIAILEHQDRFCADPENASDLEQLKKSGESLAKQLSLNENPDVIKGTISTIDHLVETIGHKALKQLNRLLPDIK